MSTTEADVACEIPASPSPIEDVDSEEFDVDDYQRALTALQVAVLKNHVLARALADARASASAATRCAPSKEVSSTQAKARSAVALFKWQRRLSKRHKAVLKAQAQAASQLHEEVRRREVEVHALAGERLFLERSAKYYESLANRAITLIEKRNGTCAAADGDENPNSNRDGSQRLGLRRLLESSSPFVGATADTPQQLESLSPATSAGRTASPINTTDNDENAYDDASGYSSKVCHEAETSADRGPSHQLQKPAQAVRPLQELHASTTFPSHSENHNLAFGADPQHLAAGLGASGVHRNTAEDGCDSPRSTSLQDQPYTSNDTSTDNVDEACRQSPPMEHAQDTASALFCGSSCKTGSALDDFAAPQSMAEEQGMGKNGPPKQPASTMTEPIDEIDPAPAQVNASIPAAELSADSLQAPCDRAAAHAEAQLQQLQHALDAALARVAELEERDERRNFYLLESVSPETAAEDEGSATPPGSTTGRVHGAHSAVAVADAALGTGDDSGQVIRLIEEVTQLRQGRETHVAAAVEAGRRSDQLQEELDGVQGQCAEAQHTATELRERCSTQEEQLSVLRAELAAAACAVAESARVVEDVRAEEAVDQLKKAVQGLQAEVERHRRERDEAAAAAAGSERDCDSAREQRDGALRAAARLQEALHAAEKRWEGLKRDAECARKEAEEAERGRGAAAARAEEEERRRAEAEAKSLAAMRERDAAADSASVALRERDDAVEEAAAALREVAAAEEKAAAALCERGTAAESAAAAQRDRDASAAEVAAARTERDAAEAEVAAALRDRDGMAEDAAAAKCERDAAEAEAAAALLERDAVADEAAAARRERDAAHEAATSALQERDTLVHDAAALRCERDAAVVDAELVRSAQAEASAVAAAQAAELRGERQQLAEVQAELARMRGEADGLRQAQRERADIAAAARPVACQTEFVAVASAACQAEVAPDTSVTCQTEHCAVSLVAVADGAHEVAAEGGVGSMSREMGVRRAGSADSAEPAFYGGMGSKGHDGARQDVEGDMAGTMLVNQLLGVKQDADRVRIALVTALRETGQLKDVAHAPDGPVACAAACQTDSCVTVHASAQTSNDSRGAAAAVCTAAVCRGNGEGSGAGQYAAVESEEARKERQRLQEQVAELQRRCQQLEGAGALQQEFRSGFAAVKEEIEGLTRQLAHAQDAERAHMQEAERLRGELAAAAAVAGVSTNRHAGLEREVERLQREMAAAAAAAAERHADLQREAERLRHRVRELEAVAAGDSREMQGLQEDLEGLEERYTVLQAAEAREAGAADELRGRLAEAHAALQAEAVAAEKARAAEVDIAERLRRERTKFKRFCDTFGYGLWD